jgi:hypothetical protein
VVYRRIGVAILFLACLVQPLPSHNTRGGCDHFSALFGTDGSSVPTTVAVAVNSGDDARGPFHSSHYCREQRTIYSVSTGIDSRQQTLQCPAVQPSLVCTSNDLLTAATFAFESTTHYCNGRLPFYDTIACGGPFLNSRYIRGQTAFYTTSMERDFRGYPAAQSSLVCTSDVRPLYDTSAYGTYDRCATGLDSGWEAIRGLRHRAYTRGRFLNGVIFVGAICVYTFAWLRFWACTYTFAWLRFWGRRVVCMGWVGATNLGARLASWLYAAVLSFPADASRLAFSVVPKSCEITFLTVATVSPLWCLFVINEFRGLPHLGVFLRSVIYITPLPVACALDICANLLWLTVSPLWRLSVIYQLRGLSHLGIFMRSGIYICPVHIACALDICANWLWLSCLRSIAIASPKHEYTITVHGIGSTFVLAGSRLARVSVLRSFLLEHLVHRGLVPTGSSLCMTTANGHALLDHLNGCEKELRHFGLGRSWHLWLTVSVGTETSPGDTTLRVSNPNIATQQTKVSIHNCGKMQVMNIPCYSHMQPTGESVRAWVAAHCPCLRVVPFYLHCQRGRSRHEIPYDTNGLSTTLTEILRNPHTVMHVTLRQPALIKSDPGGFPCMHLSEVCSPNVCECVSLIDEIASRTWDARHSLDNHVAHNESSPSNCHFLSPDCHGLACGCAHALKILDSQLFELFNKLPWDRQMICIRRHLASRKVPASTGSAPVNEVTRV